MEIVEEELQLPQPPLEVVVNIQQALVLNSINGRLYKKHDDPQGDSKRLQPPTIYRVRANIRNEDPKAYKPQVVAIGPYHRGDTLLLPMECLKEQYLRDLLARHTSNSVDSYILRLSEPNFLDSANRCYSEPVVLSEEGNAFVEMMVLDGSFIIEFLVKSVLNEYMGQLDFVNMNRSAIQNDLLLLENQIPLSVLECLYYNTVIPGFPDNFGPRTMKNLYFRYISRNRVGSMPPTPLVVHHLLHLHHSFLAPAGNVNIPSESWTFRSVLHSVAQPYISVLSWLLLYLLSFRRPPPYKPLMEMEMPTWIPNATDMNNFGIKFGIKETSCLLDVTFRVSDGVMEMPQLRIQAPTVSHFRNLVAFEQCCPDAGCHFTAYVMLIDSLIDEPNDVAVLERRGVLVNKLGAREEVAKFFNTLGKGIYLNYSDHYLSGLFEDVKGYRARERNKKRATIHKWKEILRKTYFNNPWSTCSLFAAVLVVLLTIGQTYMAFLAYYSPPSAKAPAPAQL